MANTLTLPTKISLLRIPLAVLFFALVWHGYLKWALAVFLLAAISDLLDGCIAKNKGMESVMGRIVDPLADRIFIISSFFVVFLGPLKYTMSLWVLIVVVAQDVLLGLFGIITFILKGKVLLRSSIPGKIATLCQEIFVPIILLRNIIDYGFPLMPFEIAVIITSLISGGHHLYLWFSTWRSNVER
jgi:phosphatidylglycerophosphate synthase